jgi:hypothetical protein
MSNGDDPAPIEVRVDNISQLFDTLDPYPFSERDLDSDAEEFIVGWARELPRDARISIVIHMPSAEVAKQNVKTLRAALNRYFTYRSGVILRDLNELFRVGRVALLIGLVVLAFCSVAARFASGLFGDTSFGRFLQESLIILGWVANWKPIEIFLYDWWPLRRRRNLYRRLSEANVEVKAYDRAGELGPPV